MSPLDEWKKIMISLPDKVFFPIVKNYLGKLETPFHKPALIESLAGFFAREETIERMLSLIDEEDALVLTAIKILDGPPPRILQKLLESRFSYLELQHLLLNLEERLLIYRDREEQIRTSPLFLEIIEKQIIDTELIFPSAPALPRPVPAPWPSDRLLSALIAFVVEHRGQILKQDGTLRKKILEDITVRFPGISRERFLLFLRASVILGCLKSDSQFILFPAEDKINAFAELERQERAILLQGAVALAADGEFHASIHECKAMGERAVQYVSVLDPERSYDSGALRALFLSVALKNGYSEEEPLRLPGLLTETGLLLPENSRWRRAASSQEELPREEGLLLIVQPDFSITMHPGLPLDLMIRITAFLELKRFDLYTNYELNRTSFQRGCSRLPGISLATLLAEHCPMLPGNIMTILKNWENEFHNVTLTRGVILVVDEERRHLVEHNPEVAGFLHRRYAPGIYLLDPAQEQEWRKALEQAGITPLPPIMELSRDHEEEETPFSFPRPKATTEIPRQQNYFHENGRPRNASGQGTRLVQKLERELKKNSFSGEELEELSARINKKLILFPEQLIPGIGEKEKNEAKGLDYTGKVRLIERALSESNALLELVERTRGGSPRRVLMKPEDLRKTGTDLLLLGRSLPEEEMVTVTVRRISLVRKLKSSLYAPDLSDTANR